MLLNIHEQLISGIYLGKGLLVVLMFLSWGQFTEFSCCLFPPLPRVNVLYIEWDSQVGTWRSWESFSSCSRHTVLESSLSYCMLVELGNDLKGVSLCVSLACFQPASETTFCICPSQHSFLSSQQVLSCGLLGVSARGQTALTLAAQVLDLGKHVSS